MQASIFTLGCRLNTADSALLTDRLTKLGYKIVDLSVPDITPSVIILNSCTVTAEAARKSRQAARKLHQDFPNAKIIITGCSAELDQKLWAKEKYVDVVIGNPDKKNIEQVISAVKESTNYDSTLSMDQNNDQFSEEAIGLFPFRSRAFIKIQEGCENFCSYCIVPYARGPERSRNYAEVLADCKHAIDQGFPEIVLTGVNTATYNDAGRNLATLVREICQFDGNFRIRLSSTEPHPDNLEILDLISEESKVCRFLHLSLQSGCDKILKSMNRKYTTKEYAVFVNQARKLIPNISIGTDVIIGFPGETELDFEQSLKFVKTMDFSNSHLFRYSIRQGTKAAKFQNQIPGNIAKNRYDRLKNITDKSRQNFIATQIGKELPVIFEDFRDDGFAYGWSDNYVQVKLPSRQAITNEITMVKISEENLPELD